jgi:signal transduction histidine kinase
VRRRLVLVFAAVTSMVAIAFIVPLCVLVRDVARERALDGADRDASALFPVLAVTVDPDALDVAVSRTPAGSAGRLRVYVGDTQVAGQPLAPDDHVRTALREGRAWSGAIDGGDAIVAPVIRSDGSIAVVQVLVPEAAMHEGVYAAWLSLGAVAMALVIGSVLLADRLARSITEPVSALAAASHRLGQGDLTARVEPNGPPEVADVGIAFNTLAERVDELLHAEREDVADLAHRLRTPLTALCLQIEQVDDDNVREMLATSAADLGRSLDGVIMQARRRSRDALPGTSDLVAVVAARAAFWQALADEQERRTALVLATGNALVGVHRDELAAALDVLLENVFAHTPDGSSYGVEVRSVDGWASVVVSDEGPGIDGPMLVRGASSTSTGLGLDIARRTAEGAGGALRLHAVVPSGLAVELTFPRIGQSAE